MESYYTKDNDYENVLFFSRRSAPHLLDYVRKRAQLLKQKLSLKNDIIVLTYLNLEDAISGLNLLPECQVHSDEENQVRSKEQGLRTDQAVLQLLDLCSKLSDQIESLEQAILNLTESVKDLREAIATSNMD